MSLRTRKPGRPARIPTPAQEAANTRSFLIFRLRGLWHLAGLLTGERCAQARAAVDAELVTMGAQSQTERFAAERATHARIEAAEAEREAMLQEIPF